MMKKRDEMFGYIKDWGNSNLSQLDFCDEKGIALGTFGYWRKQYLNNEETETTVKGFKPIKLSPKTKSSYKITYPNGVCISLPLGIEKDELAKLIRCLD